MPKIAENGLNVPEINCVLDLIIKMLNPNIIYLFNRKIGTDLKTKSFKLCIIVDTANKAFTEQSIYMEIDCDLPFDILIYTPEEWLEYCDKTDSFANKIKTTGLILYA